MSTAGKKLRFEDLSREQLIKACYALGRQCGNIADEYGALEAKNVRLELRLTKAKVDVVRANRRADFLQEELMKNVVLDADVIAGLVSSGSGASLVVAPRSSGEERVPVGITP